MNDTLAVVLLAAGASARMGCPKLLLAWRQSTVLEHLLAQWRSIGPAQMAIVIARDNGAVQAELDRLEFPAS